jgi:hypothetical protein
MTAQDLIDIFVKALMRDIGGTRRRWRTVLGEVRVYSTETHAHCNWSIEPMGGAGENAAVERLADRLRGEYPIVTN